MSEPIHGTQDLDKIVIEIDIAGFRPVDQQDLFDLGHMVCKGLRDAGIPIKSHIVATPGGDREVFDGVWQGRVTGETIGHTRVITWYRHLIIH